ncbi:MAG: reverse transcriptase/maturase family protein [Eubacterium sp.]
MEKIKNVYDKITCFENLYMANKAAEKGKRYRKDVLNFNANLESNLFEIQRQLNDKTYEIGKYREFYIYEPKKRLIMALPYRDRVVQHAIYRQIYPIIDARFYEHSYACRPGKGSFAALDTLQGWLKTIEKTGEIWYYCIFDMTKFFYRVSHEIVMWDFDNRVDDPDLRWLMDKIINSTDKPFGLPDGVSADKCAPQDRLFDVGVPIGNLTSQTCGNMYLDNLDTYIIETLQYTLGIDEKRDKQKGYYIRYMDDGLLISKSKKELWKDLEKIKVYIESVLELKLNNKTHVGRCTNGIDFLGCHVKAQNIKPKRAAIKRMEKRLVHVRTQHKKGKMTKEALRQTENSYIGRLEHFDCEKIMEKYALQRGRNE